MYYFSLGRIPLHAWKIWFYFAAINWMFSYSSWNY